VYPEKEAIFINGCSEDITMYAGISDADVCFSSPPYFNTEIYCEEESQSCIKYPEVEVWLDKFLEATMLNCKLILKEGGYYIINIADTEGIKLQEEAYNRACKHYKYERYFLMAMPKLYGREKYEPIFVFKKTKAQYENPTYENISKSMTQEFNTFSKIKSVEYDYNKIDRIYRVKGVPDLSADDKITAIKMIQEIHNSGSRYSRDAIRDLPIRRFPYPVWCIEKAFGTWNNFLREACIPVIAEVETIDQIISNYLWECLAQHKTLSFYEYGKIRGNKYTLKMKRLFNAGKKYSNLKQSLFEVSLDIEKHNDFLDKFKS